MFRETTLNGLMALSKEHWAEARATISTLLSRLIINMLTILIFVVVVQAIVVVVAAVVLQRALEIQGNPHHTL